MTINFENYGRFYVSLQTSSQEWIDYRGNQPHTLKECTDFIEYKLSNLDFASGIICDWDTGEIVATVVDETEDDYGEPYFNEDMGFDPYMGCYTDDC